MTYGDQAAFPRESPSGAISPAHPAQSIPNLHNNSFPGAYPCKAVSAGNEKPSPRRGGRRRDRSPALSDHFGVQVAPAGVELGGVEAEDPTFVVDIVFGLPVDGLVPVP